MAVDLLQLECFVALSRELHFGRAAEELSVSTSTFSKRIADLESELRVELFHRTTRKVRTTPAGELLLVKAERVLADMKELSDAARDAAAGRAGVVRTRYAPGAVPFARLLAARVHQRHPGIEVSLERSSAIGDGAAFVARGEAELAVVDGVALEPGMSKLVLTTLPRDTVLLSVGHPLASRPSVSLDDLADETFIVADPSTHPPEEYARYWQEFAAVVGCRVRYTSIRSGGEPQDLVAAGAGLMLVSSRRGTQHSAGIVSLRVDDPLPSGAEVWLVWRTDNAAPAVDAAVAIARSLLPEFADLDEMGEPARPTVAAVAG